MQRVPAERQVDTLVITEFIANQDIPFGLFGVLVGTGRTQEQFKLRAGFRRFNPCGAVVAVLDNGNPAL